MPEKPVNVLVTSDIGEHNFNYVVNLSPRISVKDASPMVQAELNGDSSSKTKLDALLAETEVIYGCWSHHPGSDLPLNLIPRAPRLKWIHSLSAGVDSFLDPDQAAITSNTAIMGSRVTVTNASGTHTTAMAELVIENMLQLAKRAPERFQWKQEKQWVEYPPALLRDKTVGIMGMGYGREVARLAKAFGMKVMATRRSARPGDRLKNVDVLLLPTQLPRLLAESDYVVVLIPLTPETYQMFGEKELRAMKPTAFLINISRGKIIDEPALIRALEEGWIAGAGLDVFSKEPLPPDNKLWELPNVVYSAHVGGDYVGNYDKLTVQFGQNLLRYLKGKRLYNVINKRKGYQTSGPHFREQF
jgi:phosphoglycerate dehydrogenase-like enzyme